MSKSSFLKGAAILGVAGIVVKIMGAFFRIPLGNIIGAQGLGYYQVGYPIFNFLLAFSIAGFPTAMSKLISEKRAKGNFAGANQVFRISMMVLLAISSIFSISLLLGARVFVNRVASNPPAFYAVVTLAPGLFFVSMQAGFRGYFQGHKNMIPTALSQIIEQFVRVGVGLTLAIYLMNYRVELAAAGASFGATAGGIAGLSYILIAYYIHKKRNPIVTERLEGEKDRTKKIIKELLTIAIPITIGASIIPLINLLDTVVVLRRLQAIGFTAAEANSLYGQLTGMATTLINLPQVLTLALAMSIVPAIAEAKARNDMDEIKKDTQSAIRLSLLLGFPAAVGLAVLASPIMQMLFPNEPANLGDILMYLSFAVLFLTQIQTMTGILQGLGKQILPVRNLMIGAAFKLVVTYILTGIPALNVKGAALGTVVAYLVAAILNFIAVQQYTKVTFDLKKILVKPILSVTVMGIMAYLTHRGLVYHIGNTFATVIAITGGAIMYGGMLIATKSITKEDLKLLPGGNKLKKLFSKLRILS